MAQISKGGVTFLIVLVLVGGGGYYGYNSLNKSAALVVNGDPNQPLSPVHSAPTAETVKPVVPAQTPAPQVTQEQVFDKPEPVVEKHAMPKRPVHKPEHHAAKPHKSEVKTVHRGTQEHSAPAHHESDEQRALKELAGQ